MENTSKIMRQQTEIKLSHQQFEQFIKLRQDSTLKPSPEILAAAKLLDAEGF